MKKILCVAILGCVSLASADSVSKLYDEFLKREAMTLTAEQGAVIQFLKALKYETQNIVELDILNPKSSFVFRDRNGAICYGDTFSQILRCKNEMGLTGVTYQGDAD